MSQTKDSKFSYRTVERVSSPIIPDYELHSTNQHQIFKFELLLLNLINHHNTYV